MGLLALKRFLHGLDSYERHYVVADFLKKSSANSQTILDVGGETRITTNNLSYFLPNREVTTLNIIAQTGIKVEGVSLPLEDDSYDAVVSIDTIEHIPKEDRKKAVSEYFRVARKEVVITGPINNEAQRQSEIRLNEQYKRLFGIDHHYVIEHLKFGDPSVSEIKELIGDREFELVYCGELEPIEKHIRISFSFCPKIRPLNKLFKLIYTTFTILNYKPIKYLDEPKPNTRRFIAHIKL